MPRQTSQPDLVRAQNRPHEPTRQPQRKSDAEARAPRKSAEPPAASAGLEAQRALLADPETIARGTSRTPRTRTRSARSTPARAARASQDAALEPSRSPSPTDPPATRKPKPRTRPATTRLLEATRARRLAREASLRAGNARAIARPSHDRLAAQPEPTAAPSQRRSGSDAPGWQQVPLAEVEAAATSRSRPAQATAGSAVARSPIAAPAQAIPSAERRLAAELREARATLAIARETTQSQREEIARLRAELATAMAPVVLEAAVESRADTAPANPHAERSTFRGRIAALEAELEDALLERAQLHRALADQQQESVDRSRSQSALEERCEQLERDLDETRRRAEDERRRHAEAQTLLAHLRAALRGADPGVAGPPDAPEEGPTANALPPIADASPPPLRTAEALAPGAAREALATPAAPAIARSLPHAPQGSAFPPIFSFWLEGQIRRSFGPLGIDSIPDLVREPLARRARSAQGPLAILLVGRGFAGGSRAFAESLIRSGAPEFVLHVADPDGAVPRIGFDEDPLRGRVVDRAFPDRPQALRACLEELEPAVVVTRELLTWQADVGPWLDLLRSANEGGAAVVLLEQSGLGSVTPDDAFAAIGERIWTLLPERYTRDPETGRRIEHFRDAFADRPTPPRNALLARLREGFELELFARFGFLAEAFVRGPVAGCFDPRQARDRRFVEQIADVDERRLESGSGSALYLVARIDPAEAR